MRLFVLCSLIVMGGCAANPGPSPTSDVAAALPQSAASAPAAAPSPPAQPAEKVSKVPFDLPAGFKPTRIDGELFYCRTMVVLGSRPMNVFTTPTPSFDAARMTFTRWSHTTFRCSGFGSSGLG